MTACSVRLSPPTAGAVDVDVNHGCQRLPAFASRRNAHTFSLEGALFIRMTPARQIATG